MSRPHPPAGRSREAAGDADRWLPYLEALFASIDVGLGFMDATGRVVAANPAMCGLFASGTTGSPADGGAADDGLEDLFSRCPAAEALATGQPTSRLVEMAGPDGAARHVETVCHPLADAAGRFFGVAAVARDVTRRERAEQDMALATQDIEMLLGSIRSILVSLDGGNRIRRFNASAETVLGLTAATVIGHDFFEVGLDWDGDAVRQAVAESRRSVAPVRVDEVHCRLPGGGERLLGLTVNPVPSPDGTPPGVLLLGQDISDIRARELKAVQERRMQAIGHLAAGIAHEINTPIQYVGYNAGFLDDAFTDILDLLAAYGRLAVAAAGQDRHGLADALEQARAVAEGVDIDYLRQEIPSAIANTRKGIRQVAEIVKAMRQMSHPGTGEKLFFDCNAAVRDIVTITRNAWKHVAEVQLDLAPELPLVYGLPHEVSQVLLNVILNAAQAVEERVGREPWVRGRIDIATQLTPESVVVAVSDNGAGIDAAARGRIFDPFFTTKAVGKGTGQGLAISHAIMTRHGGSIDFTTRPGEGTTFFIRFPSGGNRGAATGAE